VGTHRTKALSLPVILEIKTDIVSRAGEERSASLSYLATLPKYAILKKTQNIYF